MVYKYDYVDMYSPHDVLKSNPLFFVIWAMSVGFGCVPMPKNKTEFWKNK